MSTLYGRKSSKITLKEALDNCASLLFNGSQGVALLYSPTCCRFAKIQSNGELTDSNNTSLSLKDVFEARVFNKSSELRWLNELDGQGRAVLISEENIASYLCESIDLEALYTVEQTYILWGEGIENQSSSGWGKLAAARIGSIDVPVTGLTSGKRVYLKCIEYLQEIDEHGNVAVVEERLMRLEVKQ
jgi:CRISPR-associated protein (TIGR03984 family)